MITNLSLSIKAAVKSTNTLFLTAFPRYNRAIAASSAWSATVCLVCLVSTRQLSQGSPSFASLNTRLYTETYH